MGPSISKAKTSFDLVNSVMTDVVTKVTSEYTQSVSATNFIDFSCTDEVYKKCIDAESAVKLAAAANNIKDPTPIGCCTISNVKQANNVNITTQQIQDNSIANKIQAALLSKIDENLQSQASGSLILNKTETERNTRIRNYVQNKFNTDIVNKTLMSFNFSNTINVKNGSAKGVEQSNVATIVAGTVAKNALDTDAQLKSDVDAVLKQQDKTSGGLDNLTTIATSAMDALKSIFTGPMMIGGGIVLVIILVMLISSSKGHGMPMVAPMSMRSVFGGPMMPPMMPPMMGGPTMSNRYL